MAARGFGVYQPRYQDPGTYTAIFRVVDPEGLYTQSSVTVTIADVPPTGTLVIPQAARSPFQEVDFSIQNAQSPSPAVMAAGFTYSFTITDPNGVTVNSQSGVDPDFETTKLKPGTPYTVSAVLTDEYGLSQTYNGNFEMLSDQVVYIYGTGYATLSWTNIYPSSNTPTTTTIGGNGQIYQFMSEIRPLSSATLLTAGATYELSTNFQCDQINANLTGINLTVHTDRLDRVPTVYGGGDEDETPYVGNGNSRANHAGGQWHADGQPPAAISAGSPAVPTLTPLC